MNTILTRALQPLRPLFAASVSRPRVSDVNGLLHGVGGAGARVRPVLGGSRITSGILPAVSPSPPSSFLFFSSSPAARANAATGVKAPEVDWYSDKWREAPLPRDLRRKRERLEKERDKLKKLLDKKGPQGLLRKDREDKLMDRERVMRIRLMEQEGKVMPGSIEGQQMIQDHINKFTQKRLDDALKRAQKKIESAFKDLDWDLLVHTRRKAKWGAKQDKFARKREEKRARYELAELDQFADIPMEEEEGEESDVWSTLEKGSTKEEGKNQGKGGRDDDKATF